MLATKFGFTLPSLSREEILFVTYKDYKKVGFIYDGDKYSFDKIINIYKDIQRNKTWKHIII